MQWLGSFLSEHDKSLQRTGVLTKEQLLDFFQKNAQKFADPDFKKDLREGFRNGRDIEELVNHMQFQLFESMGVQGHFGINFLSSIRTKYGNDAELLTQFYQHVQREEMALDEAEMSDQDFARKYEAMEQMKQHFEEKMKELQGKPVEEQQRLMAEMQERMVYEQQTGMGGGPMMSVSKEPAVRPPAEAQASLGTNMTEEEQMAFFQSLKR